MGFELSEEAVREKYGEGWSKKKTPAAPPPTLPAKPAPAGNTPPGDGKDGEGTANFAEMAGGEAIDALVAEALGDWQGMLAPMVDPIQRALDEATAAGETADEFLARLPALLEQMNPGALLKALTKAALTSRLAGNAGVSNG